MGKSIVEIINRILCRHVPEPRRRSNGYYIYGIPRENDAGDYLAEIDRGQRRYAVMFTHPELITDPDRLRSLGKKHTMAVREAFRKAHIPRNTKQQTK